MSGHSKWATIKHKKGAADAKRGQVFSKMAKELMVLARSGGSDPTMNAALRNCIQKAKSYNMPNDNIDRAIKKGAGELGGAIIQEVAYEGFASGGVGLVVQVLTDNKNRAAAEIRHVFGKHGSDFASQGAVSRNFERRGQIFVESTKATEERLMEVVLEAGADDLQLNGEQFEILTPPAALTNVTTALEKAGIPFLSGEVAMVPLLLVPVSEKSVAQSVNRFVDDLEANDDVQNVYSNMDVSDALQAELDKE
jgi:YebC/PmpR family DNA-binding regulatory protein